MLDMRVLHRAGLSSAVMMVCLLAMASPSFAGNLLVNGGFEQGLKGWTPWPHGADILRVDPKAGRDGKAAAWLHVPASKDSATLYHNSGLAGLQVYAMEYWYKPAFKNPSAQDHFGITINFNRKGGPNGSAGRLVADIPLDGKESGWRHQRLIFIAPKDAVSAQIIFHVQAAQGGVWLDDVQLTASDEPILHRTATPPTIDGRLDDAEWKDATPLEGFWHADRAANEASTLTTAYMAYDDDNLYIAFRNDEPHLDERHAKTTQRDGNIWSDDCVEAFIVPPKGQGVHLGVNSLNTQGDLALVRNEAGDIHQDKSWNGQWQSATATADKAWMVEMKIPFATLKAHPKPGEVWKIDLCRERYVGLPQYTHWNRAVGGFGIIEKFASLRFEKDQARLERFTEDLSTNPLAIERPKATFKTVLGDKPGRYDLGAWTGDMYLSAYPKDVQKKYTKETWKPRAEAMLDRWGEAGMNGPPFPWSPGALGWDMLQRLNQKYGMTYRLTIDNSSLNRQAREQGAKWVYPGGGRVSIIDPALIKTIKAFAGKYLDSDPRVRKLLHSIEGIDEPSNGLFATFSPTRRPEMKEALADLDQQIRKDFGHGKYGLFDQFAAADSNTPFERIAFLKWWNHNLADAIGQLQAFFKERAPDVPFVGFDINSVSAMNPADVTQLSAHTDWVSSDPYPTSTLAHYGRARALYHTGYTTKFLKDLSGGKPLRVILQGFIYYGRGPTPADAREWASQALKNGADGLMWYESGPANLTIPKTYDEALRINGVVHKMNRLVLPQETHTAIFFCQINRWAQADTTMHAPYTLYTLLGERLGSWFRFVSDTQLAANASALDAYKLIYVPQLEYADRATAQHLIDRAKAGATLVIFDPQALSWASDGTSLSDLRQEAKGPSLGKLRTDARLIVAKGADIAGLPAGTDLPLSPIADRAGAGKVRAYALDDLPKDAHILATYQDGTPAAYRVSLGKGSVIWFAAQPFGDSDLVLHDSGWEKCLGAWADQAGEKTKLPIWHFLIPSSG
jgi:hypothetical protein